MPNVITNKYGFREIENKPSQNELSEYYAKKYYSDDKQFNNYQKNYSEAEKSFFSNRVKRKVALLEKHFGTDLKSKSILDVGCGEGWILNYFHEEGINVQGLEFSRMAASQVNPHVAELVQEGDVFENIENLASKGDRFDVIILDNVLEHVIDPEYFVNAFKKILNPKGVLIVEVPNDFSVLQKHLMDTGRIDREFWVAYPDHLSYFNFEGLKALFEQNDWSTIEITCDFPIDMNLLNENTNYVMDKTKGKSVHFARIEWENLLDSISIENANELFAVYAKMGLGRNLIGYFTFD